jgi:hypothetical protein
MIKFNLVIIFLLILAIYTYSRQRDGFQLVTHQIQNNDMKGVETSLLNNLPRVEEPLYEMNLLNGNDTSDSIHFFANNVFDPKCCKYSNFSSRGGCACITYEQVNI